VGGVVLGAGLVFVLLSSWRTKWWRACASGVVIPLRKLIFHVVSVAAVPKFKLLFTCYQVVVEMPSVVHGCPPNAGPSRVPCDSDVDGPPFGLTLCSISVVLRCRMNTVSPPAP
jgi:hypothetical protein